MVRRKDRGKIKIGRGISTARQMSRGLRGNICDATKRPRYQVARKKIENFTRQEEKGRRKAPSSKMYATKKKTRRKTSQRYKIDARKQSSRTDHTAHEEKKFYAAKINFYAARQICGNNRTIGANLKRQMNSQSGEKNITRQQLFYRGISKKNETRHLE
jgi:hypothetical protein